MSEVPPYPDDIRPLTALRFFAAWVVVCYHLIYLIDSYFPAAIENGVPIHAKILPFLQKGYMAVDFFFILSGFILMHVYAGMVADRKTALRFYLRRLARVYPLHLILVLFFTFLFAVGFIPGFSWDGFLANIFMVQSWGPNQLWPRSFNGPSWSISAEWMAYLCFPVLVQFIGRQSPRRALVLTSFIMAAISVADKLVFGHYASDQVTWSMFRILPEFTFGMALYLFFRSRRPVPEAGLVLGGLAVLLLILINTTMPDAVLLFLLGAIVGVAADLSRDTHATFLSSPRWVFLGSISYSIYMLHYPLMVVMLGGVLGAHGLAGYEAIYLPLALVFAVILIGLSTASYKWFETPLRHWIAGKADRL